MNRNSLTAVAVMAAMLSVAAAGCTDTRVLPTSVITETNVFKDVNAYRAFLAKLYTGLATSGQQGPAGRPDIGGIDEGFSQYLRLYWEVQELPTDEAVIGWGDEGLPEMNTQMWTSQSKMAVAMYYRIYFQVTLANEFLRQTTPAVLTSRGVSAADQATVNTYRAEARFLRALSYAHAIDIFGNVPLVTETELIGGAPPAQSTRAAVYAFVVSELTAIQASLPAAGAATYGRANPGAANMLLAHVYLNAGVYTGTPAYGAALAAASAAIAGPYTIDPVFTHLFRADNHTSAEMIFPIPQDGIRTQTYGGVSFLAHAGCGGSMSNAAYGLDGCWYGLRVKPEAYNRFSAGDVRASHFYTAGQSVAITDGTNFNHGIGSPKFQNITSGGAPGSNSGFVDTDFPMYRLADAYLIYIEAHVRGGGGTAAQALTYFNALRQRAFGDATHNLAAFPAANAAALDTVLAERGRELFWEAHRRSDLVRFGLFTGGTYLWACKGSLTLNNCQPPVATPAFRDLYPLPAGELVNNPNLTQNPGY